MQYLQDNMQDTFKQVGIYVLPFSLLCVQS